MGRSKFCKNVWKKYSQVDNILLSPPYSQCLKIIKNVSFGFFNFGIFYCILRSGNTVWLQITKNDSFEFLAFFINICPIKIEMYDNSVDLKVPGFQKLPKIDHFCTLNELLSTQNVNLARFARNVEWDFFLWFSNTVLSVCFSDPRR